MTPLPLPDGFADDAGWLVQAVDPHAGLARLLRMDREAYRSASFLDARILAEQRDHRLCRLDDLAAAAPTVPDPPAGWIFHIGHVGSTLVSRLLGELEGVLAIREPGALRDLAAASEQERPELARWLSRLLARRSNGDLVTIVKATSFVSEMAPLLVEPEAPVLLLYATPANYVAGILAGANSVRELAALHESRVARLAGRGITLAGLEQTDAGRAALAWACEMTSLEAAAGAFGDAQVMWADFDAMLADMPDALGRTAQLFGLNPSGDRVAELASGPLMRRYSKALEFDYSPGLRAELLADAAHRYESQIGSALASLRLAAATVPLLKRALGRAGTES